MKKTLFWIITIITPIIALIIAAEFYHYIFITKKRMYQYDSEIGWTPKSNLSYSILRQDIAGNKYNVKITTNEHGFRAWGEVNSDKKKILFIGDSFTGDDNMSNGDSFYGRAKTLINAEVFAFGGGGYGTLQELMILKRYVNSINPDVFVLQFCTNDFVNNSFYLEGRSIVRNQKNLRPYLHENKIIYRLHSSHWYPFLYKNSAVFRSLDSRLQQVQFKLYEGYTPPTDPTPKKTNIEQINAEKTTEQLLKMIANSVPEHTKLLTFSCDTRDDAKTERWIRISVVPTKQCRGLKIIQASHNLRILTNNFI